MTVLMPSWYYEKKDLKRSPSILDGLDADRESRYRREGARFIINVGTKMGLRYDTMATGVVYFHRFYMFHSFKTFPRYVTACCCLFLAGKVEETPKKCKDIIRIAKTFLAESQLTQFGDDPEEEVMTLERILLQTIKFDLQVDHPYGYLLRYAKSLKGDKEKLQRMVQMAWTFINDSLCTTLCLQFEPEVIAIALMYLAGKLSKFEVVDWIGRIPRNNHWWDMFVEGMSIDLLEDICHQVLDLYSAPMPNTPQDSPPATPPTKSTRKTSQPPSPIETATSPAPALAKPKEPVVGQPIPRLEPGELKRKVAQSEPKKEPPEPKVPRITEGKAIPIITNIISPKGSLHESDTQLSTPASPILAEEPSKMATVPKKAPGVVIQRSTSSEDAFVSSIAVSQQSLLQNVPPEIIPAKPAQPLATMPLTSFPPTVPVRTTTGQPASAFYAHESQSFPNIQQPPPQIYPMQFQHPPPVPPSGPPPPLPSGQPPQFSQATLPPVVPYNSQYPPPLPPSGMPPSLISNPPPGMLPRDSAQVTQHPPSHPQGMPPGMMQRARSSSNPPGRPQYGHGEMFQGPGGGLRPPVRSGRTLDHRQPRPVRFEGAAGGFRVRRDSEGPFHQEGQFEAGFSRSHPPRQMQFRPGFDHTQRHPVGRRFPHDGQRKMGPRPPMGSMGQLQQGAATSTGVPTVRISGSM